MGKSREVRQGSSDVITVGKALEPHNEYCRESGGQIIIQATISMGLRSGTSVCRRPIHLPAVFEYISNPPHRPFFAEAGMMDTVLNLGLNDEIVEVKILIAW